MEYPLGSCDAAVGDVDRDSRRGGGWHAIRGMVRGQCWTGGGWRVEHGRLAVAEESVGPLLADLGQIGGQAGRVADQVDLYTGRRAAIVRRIERRWSRASDQAGLLRLVWQLETEPVAVLPVGQALERMAKEAPGDDRVWLGLAELARRGEIMTRLG